MNNPAKFASGLLAAFLVLPFLYIACDKTPGESIPTAPTSTNGTGSTTGGTSGSTTGALVLSLSTSGGGFIVGKNSSMAVNATVTSTSGGVAQTGKVVTFSIDDSSLALLYTNESGSTSTATATTDASGVASVIIYSGAKSGRVVLTASAGSATTQSLTLFLSWIAIDPTTFTFNFVNSAVDADDRPCAAQKITRYYVTGNSGTVRWTNVRTDLGYLAAIPGEDTTRMDYYTLDACGSMRTFGDTVYVTDESGNTTTSAITINANVDPS